MFKHLLKLMWNKRRSNLMLFLEILLVFFVLFGVSAFGLFNYERYSSPLGFSYENSLGVRVDLDDNLDSAGVRAAHQRIRDEILAIPGIEAASWIGPVNPFGGSTWSTGGDDYGFNIHTMMMFTDTYFGETAEVTMREGRWFDETDENDKYPPMIVNGAFVDEYFPDATTMIDSVLPVDGEHRIVGVVDEFKYHSNFAERYPLTFYSHADRQYAEDPYEMLIVRTAPGRTAEVEEPLYNMLVRETKSSTVVIWNMAKDRIKANRTVMIPLIILTIISGFLLINVALGLFGVLFTQIQRRRAEIGLRKAMGATPGEVTLQFVLEMAIVTGGALLLGTLLAIQVPLLELLPDIPSRFFYGAIVVAIAIILVIVLLCSFLPSRQAAGLQPAVVLHEE